MKDKINPNLKRLAELTCNPSLELPDLEKIIEKTPIQTNKLERNENGKPRIKLTPLEKTVVNTPTKEAQDTLLQVYECGGWKWLSGNLPTSKNYWKDYKDERCVCVGYEFWDKSRKGVFGCSPKSFYIQKGYQILQPQEFYNKQNITNDMIKQINEYFQNQNS